MLKLPREILLIILKMKTRQAIIERLEKALLFPVLTQTYTCTDGYFCDHIDTYIFHVKRLEWLIDYCYLQELLHVRGIMSFTTRENFDIEDDWMA